LYGFPIALLYHGATQYGRQLTRKPRVFGMEFFDETWQKCSLTHKNNIPKVKSAERL